MPNLFDQFFHPSGEDVSLTNSTAKNELWEDHGSWKRNIQTGEIVWKNAIEGGAPGLNSKQAMDKISTKAQDMLLTEPEQMGYVGFADNEREYGAGPWGGMSNFLKKSAAPIAQGGSAPIGQLTLQIGKLYNKAVGDEQDVKIYQDALNDFEDSMSFYVWGKNQTGGDQVDELFSDMYAFGKSFKAEGLRPDQALLQADWGRGAEVLLDIASVGLSVALDSMITGGVGTALRSGARAVGVGGKILKATEKASKAMPKLAKLTAAANRYRVPGTKLREFTSGAALGFGLREVIQTEDHLTDNGMSMGGALPWAVASGVMSGYLEYRGNVWMHRFMPEAEAAVKIARADRFKEFGLESLQEGVTEFTQSLTSDLAKDVPLNMFMAKDYDSLGGYLERAFASAAIAPLGVAGATAIGGSRTGIHNVIADLHNPDNFETPAFRVPTTTFETLAKSDPNTADQAREGLGEWMQETAGLMDATDDVHPESMRALYKWAKKYQQIADVQAHYANVLERYKNRKEYAEIETHQANADAETVAAEGVVSNDKVLAETDNLEGALGINKAKLLSAYGQRDLDNIGFSQSKANVVNSIANLVKVQGGLTNAGLIQLNETVNLLTHPAMWSELTANQRTSVVENVHKLLANTIVKEDVREEKQKKFTRQVQRAYRDTAVDPTSANRVWSRFNMRVQSAMQTEGDPAKRMAIVEDANTELMGALRSLGTGYTSLRKKQKRPLFKQMEWLQGQIFAKSNGTGLTADDLWMVRLYGILSAHAGGDGTPAIPEGIVSRKAVENAVKQAIFYANDAKLEIRDTAALVESFDAVASSILRVPGTTPVNLLPKATQQSYMAALRSPELRARVSSMLERRYGKEYADAFNEKIDTAIGVADGSLDHMVEGSSFRELAEIFEKAKLTAEQAAEYVSGERSWESIKEAVLAQGQTSQEALNALKESANAALFGTKIPFSNSEEYKAAESAALYEGLSAGLDKINSILSPTGQSAPRAEMYAEAALPIDESGKHISTIMRELRKVQIQFWQHAAETAGSDDEINLSPHEAGEALMDSIMGGVTDSAITAYREARAANPHVKLKPDEILSLGGEIEEAASIMASILGDVAYEHLSEASKTGKPISWGRLLGDVKRRMIATGGVRNVPIKTYDAALQRFNDFATSYPEAVKPYIRAALQQHKANQTSGIDEAANKMLMEQTLDWLAANAPTAQYDGSELDTIETALGELDFNQPSAVVLPEAFTDKALRGKMREVFTEGVHRALVQARTIARAQKKRMPTTVTRQQLWGGMQDYLNDKAALKKQVPLTEDDIMAAINEFGAGVLSEDLSVVTPSGKDMQLLLNEADNILVDDYAYIESLADEPEKYDRELKRILAEHRARLDRISAKHGAQKAVNEEALLSPRLRSLKAVYQSAIVKFQSDANKRTESMSPDMTHFFGRNIINMDMTQRLDRSDWERNIRLAMGEQLRLEHMHQMQALAKDMSPEEARSLSLGWEGMAVQDHMGQAVPMFSVFNNINWLRRHPETGITMPAKKQHEFNQYTVRNSYANFALNMLLSLPQQNPAGATNIDGPLTNRIDRTVLLSDIVRSKSFIRRLLSIDEDIHGPETRDRVRNMLSTLSGLGENATDMREAERIRAEFKAHGELDPVGAEQGPVEMSDLMNRESRERDMQRTDSSMNKDIMFALRVLEDDLGGIISTNKKFGGLTPQMQRQLKIAERYKNQMQQELALALEFFEITSQAGNRWLASKSLQQAGGYRKAMVEGITSGTPINWSEATWEAYRYVKSFMQATSDTLKRSNLPGALIFQMHKAGFSQREMALNLGVIAALAEKYKEQTGGTSPLHMLESSMSMVIGEERLRLSDKPEELGSTTILKGNRGEAVVRDKIVLFDPKTKGKNRLTEYPIVRLAAPSVASAEGVHSITLVHELLHGLQQNGGMHLLLGDKATAELNDWIEKTSKEKGLGRQQKVELMNSLFSSVIIGYDLAGVSPATQKAIDGMRQQLLHNVAKYISYGSGNTVPSISGLPVVRSLVADPQDSAVHDILAGVLSFEGKDSAERTILLTGGNKELQLAALALRGATIRKTNLDITPLLAGNAFVARTVLGNYRLATAFGLVQGATGGDVAKQKALAEDILNKVAKSLRSSRNVSEEDKVALRIDGLSPRTVTKILAAIGFDNEVERTTGKAKLEADDLGALETLVEWAKTTSDAFTHAGQLRRFIENNPRAQVITDYGPRMERAVAQLSAFLGKIKDDIGLSKMNLLEFAGDPDEGLQKINALALRAHVGKQLLRAAKKVQRGVSAAELAETFWHEAFEYTDDDPDSPLFAMTTEALRDLHRVRFGRDNKPASREDAELLNDIISSIERAAPEALFELAGDLIVSRSVKGAAESAVKANVAKAIADGIGTGDVTTKSNESFNVDDALQGARDWLGAHARIPLANDAIALPQDRQAVAAAVRHVGLVEKLMESIRPKKIMKHLEPPSFAAEEMLKKLGYTKEFWRLSMLSGNIEFAKRIVIDGPTNWEGSRWAGNLSARSEGLGAILADARAAGVTEDMWAWLTVKRQEELEKETKRSERFESGTGYDIDDLSRGAGAIVRAHLALKYGQNGGVLTDFAKRIVRFTNEAVLKPQLEIGMLSQEQYRDLVARGEWYIPLKRVEDMYQQLPFNMKTFNDGVNAALQSLKMDTIGAQHPLQELVKKVMYIQYLTSAQLARQTLINAHIDLARDPSGRVNPDVLKQMGMTQLTPRNLPGIKDPEERYEFARRERLSDRDVARIISDGEHTEPDVRLVADNDRPGKLKGYRYFLDEDLTQEGFREYARRYSSQLSKLMNSTARKYTVGSSLTNLVYTTWEDGEPSYVFFTDGELLDAVDGIHPVVFKAQRIPIVSAFNDMVKWFTRLKTGSIVLSPIFAISMMPKDFGFAVSSSVGAIKEKWATGSIKEFVTWPADYVSGLTQLPAYMFPSLAKVFPNHFAPFTERMEGYASQTDLNSNWRLQNDTSLEDIDSSQHHTEEFLKTSYFSPKSKTTVGQTFEAIAHDMAKWRAEYRATSAAAQENYINVVRRLLGEPPAKALKGIKKGYQHVVGQNLTVGARILGGGFTGFSDSLSRQTERKHADRKARAMGAKEGKAQGIYKDYLDRRLTIDFARKSKLLATVNNYWAFAAPALQDLSLFLSRVSSPTGARKFLMRAFIAFTLPALVNWLVWHDDKEWQQLPAWEKSNFLYFGHRDHTTDPNIDPTTIEGGFWRIPWGIGIAGAFFKDPLLAALQYGSDNDPLAFRDHGLNILQQSPLSIGNLPTEKTSPLEAAVWSVTPAALEVPIALYSNKDQLTEDPVDPTLNSPAQKQSPRLRNLERNGVLDYALAGVFNSTPRQAGYAVTRTAPGLGAAIYTAANLKLTAIHRDNNPESEIGAQYRTPIRIFNSFTTSPAYGTRSLEVQRFMQAKKRIDTTQADFLAAKPEDQVAIRAKYRAETDKTVRRKFDAVAANLKRLKQEREKYIEYQIKQGIPTEWVYLQAVHRYDIPMTTMAGQAMTLYNGMKYPGTYGTFKQQQ